MKRKINGTEYTDYPDKYAKKVDWWRSDNGIALIRGWRCNGASIKQVVSFMGIDPRTFNSWRKKYPEFDEAMELGSEVANLNVVRSLYNRALGYDWWEETYELVEGEMLLTRKVRKHVPADVKAILSFLYNRMPNQWRSIQEPLESTQYTQTVKNILIAMKEVADNEEPQCVEVSDDQEYTLDLRE